MDSSLRETGLGYQHASTEPEMSRNRSLSTELRVQIPVEDRSRRARTPESSFQALTKAVSYLSNLDDYFKESLGSGFFSDVFKVNFKF